MKKLLIFLVTLQIKLYFAHLEVSLNSSDLISRVFCDIIQEFYVKRGIRFNLVVKEVETVKINEIIDGIGAQSDGNFSYQILKDSRTLELYNELQNLHDSSIIFMNSSNRLLEFNSRHLPFNRFPKERKIFIYCDDLTVKDLENPGEFIWIKKLSLYIGKIEQFEYFITDDVDFIYLSTIVWFTEYACNIPRLKILNRFNKTSRKWEKILHDDENKFTKNFHGCRLVMFTQNLTSSAFESFTVDENHTRIQPSGMTYDIMEIGAKKFNFTVYYQPAFCEHNLAVFPHNECYLLPLNGVVVNPNVCFRVETISSGYKDHPGLMERHFTPTYDEVKNIFLVTPGELYTNYEKLYLPFDKLTWLLLIGTFGAAFTAIFIINNAPKYIQNIFYGEGIQMPAFNVLGAFFGIGQTKLPAKNFPRFILLMFIIFCLIFRTCYQSKLFEFMTSEMRRPPPKTAADLIERNYTVYAMKNAFHRHLFQEQYIKWPTIYEIDSDDYFDFFKNLYNNASAKVSLLIQEHIILYITHQVGWNVKWLRLEDPMYIEQIGFSVLPNNFMLEPLEVLMSGLIPSGVMRKLVDDKRKGKITEVTGKNSQIFALSDLEFGFVVWLIVSGFSLLVFFSEILSWPWIGRKKPESNEFAKVHPIVTKEMEKKATKDTLNVFRKKKMPRKLKFSKIHPINDNHQTAARGNHKMNENLLKYFRIVRKNESVVVIDIE